MHNMSQEIHEYPWDMDSQSKGIQYLTDLLQPGHFVVEQQQRKDLENLKDNSDTIIINLKIIICDDDYAIISKERVLLYH